MVIETPVIDINNSTLILGLDPFTRFCPEELQAAYRIDDPEDDDLEIDEPKYEDDEEEDDEYEDDDEDEYDDEDDEDDDEESEPID